jgi:4-amino-4-deoxy-L-arabinose transferase-like glycosyltransferase
MKMLNTVIHKLKHLKTREKWELAAVAAIFIFAAFFRFYRIEEFITFLGDQGRDAIVMKRIITGEHFPAIGPRSSVGQLFLGPFYYYLMAPFLLLFRLNPLGPAAGVALIATISIPIIYWIVRKESNMWTAMVTILLITFSYINVWLSRFSWNPNLLPVFGFFTIYCGVEMLKRKSSIPAFLFGALLAASIQLHYLALLLIPPILLMLAMEMYQDKKHIIKHLIKIAVSGVGFCIVLAPLILFDIKNNFLNVRGMIGIFTIKGHDSNTSYLDQLTNTGLNFLHHTFQIPVSGTVGIIFVGICAVLTVYLFIKRKDVPELVLGNALAVTLFMFLFAVLDGERHPHYYTPIYYSLFLVVGYLISRIRLSTLRAGAVVLLMAIYYYFNIPNYVIWQKEGNYQTHIAESVADTIIKAGTQSPFYLVSVPFANTNDHIRYYLELKGHTPLPDDTTEMAQDLVILCYDKGPKGCDVMNEPQYLVVHFGDRKIDKIVHHKEVTIYRLLHAR